MILPRRGCGDEARETTQDGDALAGRAIGKTHQAAMWPFIHEDQQAEIRIDRDQNPVFVRRSFKNRRITRILQPLAGVLDIMPFVAEPLCERYARAAVHQEAHYLINQL